MLWEFDRILTQTKIGSSDFFILGITSNPLSCWRTDLKIMGEVKTRVPIHESAMTLGILFRCKRECAKMV